MSDRSLLRNAYTSSAELGRMVVGARSIIILASSTILLGLSVFYFVQSYRVHDEEEQRQLREQALLFFLITLAAIALVFLNLYLTQRYEVYAAGQGLGAFF